MTNQIPTASIWRLLSFSLPEDDLARLREFVARAQALDLEGPADADTAAEIESLRDRAIKTLSAPNAALSAALHVLADLLKQGRRLRLRDDDQLEFEATIAIDARDPADAHAALKSLRRGQLLVERTNQLREASVRDFINGMERRRLYGHRFVSIYSVMRDGRALADELTRVREEHTDPSARAVALRDVIDPYLQFIEGEEACVHTGLKLRDIWRYFRHTWSTVYRSVPGRSMMILIRDRAAKDHPVIGIAALSSPAMQLRARDLWVGWHPDCAPGSAPPEGAAAILQADALAVAWLRDTVQRAFEEIFVDDFIEEGVMTVEELRSPSEELISWLKEEVTRQRSKHREHAAERDYKRELGDDWEGRARTHLYRSKRAEALAWLLNARLALAALPEAPSDEDARAWFEDADNARVAKKILRKAKADRVGVAVCDISVCGAISPYNALLGGKLVCMLLSSPEVREAYDARYSGAPSVIASSVAGREISRPAHLVLLGTTSLYGRSSQYNRVRVPADKLGLGVGRVCYEELGATEGYGTNQFGDETAEALSQFVSQRHGGQRVNSIFGEGTSPRLRKIRQGIEALGLNSDILLQHGARRAMYVVPLALNLREYLIGLEDTPRYAIDGDGNAATAAIGAWWRARWLTKRVCRDEVIDSTRAHTLIHPIRHGARVTLPSVNTEQQLLFDPYGR